VGAIQKLNLEISQEHGEGPENCVIGPGCIH